MTKRVTAIEAQKKNPQRVNVYLDGQFAFGLSAVIAAWLKTGQELDEEKIASLQAADEQETVYQKALHFLSYRPRSSAEVRRNLLKRGFSAAITDETINRLQKAGLVNDTAFAQAWVENRNTFRPRSRNALRVELRRKGLDDETIIPLLDSQVNDEALALAAAAKYARRLKGLAWQEFRQKLGGFLSRRGFTYEIIAPVVSEIWKQNQMADSGDTFIEEE